jgi:Cys-tRNA(Pro)/Cys-tRNA(Cys) deacylase
VEKPTRTNVTRLLDGRNVHYEVLTFSSDIHSAQGVAEVVGIPVEQVYKSLVVMREHGKPLVVMVGGDRELSLKQVARAVGEKKVRMATVREAESLTGLRVGGISALALLSKPFEIFIDERALEHECVLLSGGKRGVNVRLAVSDLVELSGAQVIDATNE